MLIPVLIVTGTVVVSGSGPPPPPPDLSVGSKLVMHRKSWRENLNTPQFKWFVQEKY